MQKWVLPFLTAIGLLFGRPGGSQGLVLDPDSILIGKVRLPSVFLVGSFHFEYYNLDAHKTEKDKQVNILSPVKQKEVEDLVAYIAKFNPTKIVIERGRNTGYLMNRYRKYLAGEYTLGKDEYEQLGFRLMKKFGLDTLYGCDAIPFSLELYDGKDSLAMRPLLDSLYRNWSFKSNPQYKKLYDYEDSIQLHLPLLEYFKWRNSDKVQNRSFGYYLTMDFKLDETRGADVLSMHWYNRNLRIFRQIQKITTSPGDRILVIYGAGHVDILRHLFECSPEYRLVKFTDLQ